MVCTFFPCVGSTEERMFPDVFSSSRSIDPLLFSSPKLNSLLLEWNSYMTSGVGTALG